MFTKIAAFLFSVVFFCTGFPLQNYDYSGRLSDEDYVGLKEYYSDYFDVGAAVGSGAFSNPTLKENILKNYTSLTGENAFKQPVIHPADGVWNYAPADAIADFCRQNGLKLRGHCLVWAAQDNWMLYEADGKTLVSKEVYLARMREHIHAMIERYGDIIHTWDVVNEPFNYNSDKPFKPSTVFELCGEDYITKAFEYAHEADPTATLVLNETGLVRNSKKIRHLFNYLPKWLEQGVPIHAIGLQTHWETFNLGETPRRIERLINRIAALGLDVQITEVDMSVYAVSSDEGFAALPQNVERLQSKKYQELFAVLRKNADKISSVSFWGLNDAASYYNAGDKRQEWPLLFDGNSRPKQAFYAITDF